MPGLWNLEKAQRKAAEMMKGQKDNAGGESRRGGACLDPKGPWRGLNHRLAIFPSWDMAAWALQGHQLATPAA